MGKKENPDSGRFGPAGIILLGVLAIILLLLASDWKEQMYLDRVRAAMDALEEEGKACAEELEAAARENIRLLDAVREAALELGDKNIPFNGVRGTDAYFAVPSEIGEVFAAAPEFVELLEAMPEAGLDWQYLRIFPGEDPSISFEMFRDGGFGGSHLLVTINSPPLDLPPDSSMNAVQVTDNWGIYWSVNAMAGI